MKPENSNKQNDIKYNLTNMETELEKITDPKFSGNTLAILHVELIPFIVGVLGQIFRSNIPDCIKYRFNTEFILNNSSTIISIETAYMGAAIAGTVFFFSIMDSGRVGIPYRKVINYKYGTSSVSRSIAFSVISLFVSVIGFLEGMNYIWCGAGASMILLQSSVLWRVLRSTSYQSNVDTITEQEKKQLIFLTNNGDNLEQLNLRYELRIDSFMGIIASSNAVTTDKTVALRKLLNVPYDNHESIKAMGMEKLFQVYYNNFRDMFVKIVPNEEQTDIVYELFFELVSDEDRISKIKVFWPMITAAWYAAFVYKPIRYEAFWTECINHMPDEYQQNTLTVFILMCGFWDRYENADLSNSINTLYDSIICFKNWHYDENMEGLLTILWNCWLGQVIGKGTDIHITAAFAPFLVLEEILREIHGIDVCPNCTIHAFVKQLNMERAENDNQKHSTAE